ncbi:MAG: radical SAM family heme chaperone HemW [Pseudomonadota bacterium]
MPSTQPEGGFGIYLHWPFCEAKCPYCDFNSHVVKSIDHTQWRKAYLSELDRYAAEFPDRIVSSIFFGGGTPSLMEPETVATIIEKIASLWRTTNTVEITLEANPSSVEAQRFRDYRSAGVNRVSLGVQALNDVDLKALGRMHSADEARAAFDIARARFKRISFDLIYARQNQTANEWRAELSQALRMAADHLSLYQLTIEPGTAFGDRYARGRLPGLPRDELAADLYDITQEMTDAAGLPVYEVSNHAAPGSESRHNLIYWRYGDYAGVGPGAHGRLSLAEGRMATVAPHRPKGWLDAAEAGSPQAMESVGDDEAAEEYAMMALRLAEGLSVSRYARLADQPFEDARIRGLVENGFVEISGDQLRATGKGRPVLNAVLRELLA